MVLELNPIKSWLVREGPKTDGVSGLLVGLTEVLNRAGLDLIRSTFLVRTLHPEVDSIRLTWTPDNVHLAGIRGGFYHSKRLRRVGSEVVEELTFSHGTFSKSEPYQRSPFKRLDLGEVEVRAKVGGPEKFEILNDIAAAGGSEYFLQALPQISAFAQRVSWATNKPGGFSDGDLELLRLIAPQVSTSLEIQLGRFVTETLLSVYLGAHTGSKVLSGKIKPGDIDEISAAIWFSDLRGFTEMSEKESSATLVSWLNDYFEAISGPIIENDGEILKFIGDAVLAIFPVGSAGEKSAASKALAAARAASSSLKSLNERRVGSGKPPMRHGIALHLGNLQYGNIGANRRLDFTVIGQSVNLASRIEGLCKSTGAEILCSEQVARHLDGLKSLGSFPLKGIKDPQAIFAADL